jgi:hypothetical protein
MKKGSEPPEPHQDYRRRYQVVPEPQKFVVDNDVDLDPQGFETYFRIRISRLGIRNWTLKHYKNDSKKYIDSTFSLKSMF